MYDRLRTHEWEKAKCAASVSTFPMTYEMGSTIIKLPPGLAREIKNHFKNLYFNYGEDFFQDKSQPALSHDLQRFQPLVKFTAECYKIYCLLLLQN
ncbi:hypothetical protein G0U57_017212, partial [Chelydra serpentina]